MSSHAQAVVLAAALAWSSAACTSYVKRGSALYQDGRYVEAAEVFERTEHRLASATHRQRAEYGLYRGLTMLVLGDYAAAHRWLTFSYEVERASPGSLRSNRRTLLDRGWYELAERMRRAPIGTASGSAVATGPKPAGSAPAAGGSQPPSDRSEHTLVPR